MKTKNNVKKSVIIFQVFAIIFFLLGIAGRILQNQDYDLLLFGRPVLAYMFMICFLLSYSTEFLVISLLFEKTKNASFFLTYIILIPLTLFHIYCMIISLPSGVTTKTYKYPEFDTTIVIENGDDLFGNYSRIYETNNKVLLKYITVLDGTPSPLGYESSYDVEFKNNKIIYTYNDDFDETVKNQLILEYENGHFKEVIN